MSWQACKRVWAWRGLTPVEKLVALCYADYADAECHNAYPSIATVAAACNLFPSSTREIAHRLSRYGVLAQEAPARRGYRNLGIEPRGVSYRIQPSSGAGALASSDLQPDRCPDDATEGSRPPAAPSQTSGGNASRPPAAPVPILPDPPVDPPVDPPPAPSALDVRFESFWKLYPRKVAKASARKAWNKLRPSQLLTDVMLAAIERQARSEQWRRENGRFIPHPATWLNGGRWEDESTPSNNGNGSGRTGSHGAGAYDSVMKGLPHGA